MYLQGAECKAVVCVVIRMDTDGPHGPSEPVATNRFRLEPVLRHHTYPAPAWHNTMDKEVLRTFVAAPFILDKVDPLPKPSRLALFMLLGAKGPVADCSARSRDASSVNIRVVLDRHLEFLKGMVSHRAGCAGTALCSMQLKRQNFLRLVTACSRIPLWQLCCSSCRITGVWPQLR